MQSINSERKSNKKIGSGVLLVFSEFLDQKRYYEGKRAVLSTM